MHPVQKNYTPPTELINLLKYFIIVLFCNKPNLIF